MILKQTEVLLFHGGLNSGVQFVTGDGHTRDCVSLSMPKIKIRGSGFCIISSSFTWVLQYNLASCCIPFVYKELLQS